MLQHYRAKNDKGYAEWYVLGEFILDNEGKSVGMVGAVRDMFVDSIPRGDTTRHPLFDYAENLVSQGKETDFVKQVKRLFNKALAKEHGLDFECAKKNYPILFEPTAASSPAVATGPNNGKSASTCSQGECSKQCSAEHHKNVKTNFKETPVYATEFAKDGRFWNVKCLRCSSGFRTGKNQIKAGSTILVCEQYESKRSNCKAIVCKSCYLADLSKEEGPTRRTRARTTH